MGIATHFLVMSPCSFAFLLTSLAIIIIVTEFWKTNQDVTFDIIYIYIYLKPSRLYCWFNKWLKQSQKSSVAIKTLEIQWKYVLIKITNA